MPSSGGQESGSPGHPGPHTTPLLYLIPTDVFHRGQPRAETETRNDAHSVTLRTYQEAWLARGGAAAAAVLGLVHSCGRVVSLSLACTAWAHLACKGPGMPDTPVHACVYVFTYIYICLYVYMYIYIHI